jgi:Arc/MetJ-type ribon-helix-helix transcriptional regulator
MKSKLDSMGKSKSEFVRRAIAKALEELDKKSGENPTDN